MALTWKQRVEDAKDRLARVRAVLAKRQERVALCKGRQAYWNKKYQATGNERPLRKVAYWHEQLDKAVLGVKDYKAREARLERKLAYLRAHKPESAPSSSGVAVPQAAWNPNRLQISESIIPWLYKSATNGWHGYVTSGYRSPTYQCEVCKRVCGNCNGCPGTCAAPGASNHGRYGPGEGAVDVTDYYTFAAVQRRIDSPLHNSLGSQDPVHFSFAGN